VRVVDLLQGKPLPVELVEESARPLGVLVQDTDGAGQRPCHGGRPPYLANPIGILYFETMPYPARACQGVCLPTKVGGQALTLKSARSRSLAGGGRQSKVARTGPNGMKVVSIRSRGPIAYCLVNEPDMIRWPGSRRRPHSASFFASQAPAPSRCP